MRLIDADALEKEGWRLNRTIRVDKNTSEYQSKPLRQVPTIEPRKKGKWIDDEGNTVTDKYCAICSACGEWSEYLTAYCPNCGAEMTEGEG